MMDTKLNNLPELTLEEMLEKVTKTSGFKFKVTPEQLQELRDYAKKHDMFVIPYDRTLVGIEYLADTKVDFVYYTSLDVYNSYATEEILFKSSNLKAHPLAELMLQYAQDALESETPWESWEFCWNNNNLWLSCTEHPLWSSSQLVYRKKPKTININGFEVPEPLREVPIENKVCYVVNLADPVKIVNCVDSKAYFCFLKQTLEKGLVHSTAEAAELHAKALLSFTKI